MIVPSHTKEFPLLTVLSITTGRLLPATPESGNGFNELGALFAWLLHAEPDDIGPASMLMFSGKCRTFLHEQFPYLRAFEAEIAESALDVICDRLSESPRFHALLMQWADNVRMALAPEPILDVLCVPRIPKGGRT